MALRFLDSFDHYTTNDLVGTGLYKWSFYSGVVSLFSISQGTGRYLNSLRLSNTSSFSCMINKTLDNQATWIIGLAFKFNGVPQASCSIISLYDSATLQSDVRINSDGTLSVTRNGTALTNVNTGTTKSANTLLPNVWYYLEFICTISTSIASNSCKVNVNGTNTGWINLTSAQSTRNTANSFANVITIGPSSSWTITGNIAVYLDFDDLYICDSTGSTNNTFLGDIRVEARFPNAAGTNTAWSASQGPAFNCVNDPSPTGDFSYISSVTTNDISTFLCTPLSTTPSTIFGIQVIHASRKTDAGTRQIADLLRSGSTNYPGTTINLSSSYSYYSTIYETDPNTSAAWTYSNVNALEIGVKEIT